MLYVQQSLGPDEEILLGARFHWMYTVNALSWILFGIGVGIAVGYAGIWWAVNAEITHSYPGLPHRLYGYAWDTTLREHGGYLNILWSLHPVVRFSILGFFLLGIVLFVHMMIVKATTEIAVTSDRIIYKKGLVARQVGEISIDRVEGVSVNQGLWGRLVGYGYIVVRGMGVGEIILPPIDAPITFVRAVQEARAIKARGTAPMKTTEDDF